MKHSLMHPDGDGKSGGGEGAAAAAGAGTAAAAATPKNVTHTEEQFNSIVNDAFGRGAGKVLSKFGVKDETEAEELIRLGRTAKQAKPPDQKPAETPAAEIKQHVDAAVERVRSEFGKQLEAKDGELEKSKQVAHRFAVENAITFAAAKKSVVNTEHVVQLLRGRARISGDGASVEVLDERGNLIYGKDGKPLPVDAFVEEWLNQNPHFLPAGVKPGAGAGDSAGGGTNGSKTIKRSEFESLPPGDKAARMRDGFKVAD